MSSGHVLDISSRKPQRTVHNMQMLVIITDSLNQSQSDYSSFSLLLFQCCLRLSHHCVGNRHGIARCSLFCVIRRTFLFAHLKFYSLPPDQLAIFIFFYLFMCVLKTEKGKRPRRQKNATLKAERDKKMNNWFAPLLYCLLFKPNWVSQKLRRR